MSNGRRARNPGCRARSRARRGRCRRKRPRWSRLEVCAVLWHQRRLYSGHSIGGAVFRSRASDGGHGRVILTSTVNLESIEAKSQEALEQRKQSRTSIPMSLLLLTLLPLYTTLLCCQPQVVRAALSDGSSDLPNAHLPTHPSPASPRTPHLSRGRAQRAQGHSG